MGRALIAACAVLIVAAAAPGCFTPDKPSCAFSCLQPPHSCPSGFMCGADGLCHDPTSARVCTIELRDAAADAGDVSDVSDVANPTDLPASDAIDALDGAGDRGQ